MKKRNNPNTYQQDIGHQSLMYLTMEYDILPKIYIWTDMKGGRKYIKIGGWVLKNTHPKLVCMESNTELYMSDMHRRKI